MQYDQQFHGQLCTDGSARSIRLGCDGEALLLDVRTAVGHPDAGPKFQTELYLDEQDREALAAALLPEPPARLSPVEHVAIGFMAGFTLTFIAFVAAWGSV